MSVLLTGVSRSNIPLRWGRAGSNQTAGPKKCPLLERATGGFEESKVRTKDALLSHLLGYRPRSHVSIEYIESLDDWKTAWNHIHFEGFLGTKMVLQFTWQGCDSLLAAPLVIDVARLALLAKRRGEAGVLRQLACFFKDPMGATTHDFWDQFRALQQYAATAAG